jgi:uncharacterized tellurite resistance protein B-like protein
LNFGGVFSFLPNHNHPNMNQNNNFQLGLLHLVHLIVNVDGHIDDREREAMARIREEENIPNTVYQEFEQKAAGATEEAIYEDGIAYLSKCTDDERLVVFVHLYKLAEADANITSKEIRFLFYGLKETKLSFEDVVMSAGMSGSKFFAQD